MTSRLAPPPPSPNCVSSLADPSDGVHHVDPLPLPPGGFDAVVDAALAMSHPRVKVREAGYAHLVFVTRLLRFKDDVELELDEEAGVVHVRSASRLGYGDAGVNRRRVEKLRAALSR